MSEIDALAARLRPHYSRFLGARAEGEVLLTAHSHQAWPDVSRDGQIAAWDDAAALVDKKWGRVMGEILSELREHVAKRIGSSRPNDLAIAPNTHELVYRLSTCFPSDGTVVITDSEFHSLSRQLRRLAEDGLTVVEVAADDPDFAARYLAAVDEHRPDWCAMSNVLFTNARIMVELDAVLAGLAERDVPVLVDTYHAFNAIEMNADAWPGTVFVTGGGYKYAQTGEGACWLLLPADAERFRPVTTGWFAAFAHLESRSNEISYAPGGDRFFGATFDPTPLYRGVYTMRFMDEQGLTPAALREASMLRTALLVEEYDRLDLAARGISLASPREPEHRGGFVTFSSDRTAELHKALDERGVRTDHRGPLLRFGPAPYTTEDEIRRGMAALAEVAA